MSKNIFNKVFLFNAVLLGLLFCGKSAFSCDVMSSDYVSCMQKACASRNAFFNGSICVTCAGKNSRASQKLQTCVSKDMTEDEEEQRYQKEEAERNAEKERARAVGCAWFQSFDEDTGKCVTDFDKLHKENKNNKQEAENNESDEGNNVQQASDMQDTYEIDTADNEADLSEDTSEGAASSLEGKQMTTTVTTNKNGEVSTQTSTKDVLGGSAGATASGDTAATSTSTATQTSADTQKAEENKQEEKKEEDTEQYDGLYNGMHIIPDIMAMHCKIKGEDVAQNPDLFVECIKQYVSEMNSPNATAKAEAEREYEMLKYKVLTDAGSTAITKSAVVNNHERATNDTVNAQSNLPTESDDNKGIMASLMFVTNMMNDVRELMVEQLKYNVISGIGDIDPAIVMQQDEAENKAEEEKTASGGENKGPEYTAGTVKVEIGDKK